MIRPSELGILADDLTGACDAASAFTACCGPVRVHIRLPRSRPFTRQRILEVVNTQSRRLPPVESRRVVMKAARLFRGATVVYKKIDSVLRGPAGAELEGLARVLPHHHIFVIPAVPEMGKTTRGGCLFEHGIPAHKTDYGKDPLSPLETNDIRRLIGRTGSLEFAVADVETSEDLDRAVTDALAKGKVILAGSVGLADSLARRMERGAWTASAAGNVRRTLVLSGSHYPTSLEQLKHAAIAFGEVILTIGRDTSVSDVAHKCHGRDVVFLRIETDTFMSGRRGRLALTSLFRKIRHVIRSCDPQALGIIGGETAFQILRLMGARRLEVLGKKQQGMPYGIISDGELAGRPFATKGGSVGTHDACVQMVNCLRQNRTGES
jgi:uncharacterized protein YgbK (DUF1537 family)